MLGFFRGEPDASLSGARMRGVDGRRGRRSCPPKDMDTRDLWEACGAAGLGGCGVRLSG